MLSASIKKAGSPVIRWHYITEHLLMTRDFCNSFIFMQKRLVFVMFFLDADIVSK